MHNGGRWKFTQKKKLGSKTFHKLKIYLVELAGGGFMAVAVGVSDM